MTCAATAPSFRLLDAYVGWDPKSHNNLVGFDDPAGLRLARTGPVGGIGSGDLDPFIPPPRLAAGCDPCEWFLATASPPSSLMLRLDGCDDVWRRAWTPSDRWPATIEALAVDRWLISGVDRAAGKVWVWSRTGVLIGRFSVTGASAIAFVSPCELLVLSGPEARIDRFDPTGAPLGPLPTQPPELASSTTERLAVAADGSVWIAALDISGFYRVFRAGCGEESFTPATAPQLAASFPDLGLRAVTDCGFCLQRGEDGPLVCFSWFGRPVSDSGLAAAAEASYETGGELLTKAIDSGVPRCRWHRVRLEAEIPDSTRVEVAVATSESSAGPIHLQDWRPEPAIDQQSSEVSPFDFLIDQPPGRYLFVRFRLTGDGKTTPAIRRVRLDFPRATSLDSLPEVYREQASAEEFSERFLSLFDGALEDFDRAVERFPALFDGTRVPEETLPWLGGFLDVVFDPAWDADRRRRVLAGISQLYRERGTVAGLRRAIQLVFDVDPVIEERGLAPPWGAVAGDEPGDLGGRLGAVRLFGRSRTRWRLGSSPLGRTPIRSYGNPDLDPLTADVHRFRVLVPPLGAPEQKQRLERLVASQKPAHTVATVRVGGDAPVLTGLAVGIDTRLVLPPSPILGETTTLNRSSIVQSGVARTPRAPIVGETTWVAANC